MACVFYHTINTCKAPGAEDKHKEREKDPQIQKAREKAKAKRKAKQSNEVARLGISTSPTVLPKPVVTPGVIKEVYGEEALSVEGAINLALPAAYMEKLLSIMNENR